MPLAHNEGAAIRQKQLRQGSVKIPGRVGWRRGIRLAFAAGCGNKLPA
jgi:hypothetical protein